jgi:hypothetical protein
VLSLLIEEVAFVLGVQRHVDLHALALGEAKTQRSCRSLPIAATRRG